MIVKAREVATCKIVYTGEVKEDYEKGDYVCEICGIPMVPVKSEGFFRTYPNEVHRNAYCRTADANMKTFEPTKISAYDFFGNTYRPEGKLTNKPTKAVAMLPKDLEEPDPDPADEIPDDDTDDEAGNSENNSEHSDTDDSATDDTTEQIPSEPAPDKLKPLTKAEILKTYSNAEIIPSNMALLYDAKFHEAPPNTRFLDSTKGDYFCLRKAAAKFMKDHGNAINGPAIIDAVFNGFSILDQTLLFSLYNIDEEQGGKPELLCRIEMYCMDRSYFRSYFLSNYLINKTTPFRYEYAYKQADVWLRSRNEWAFTPADKCSGCLFRTLNKTSQCGTCKGLCKSELVSTEQILLYRWKTVENVWVDRATKQGGIQPD